MVGKVVLEVAEGGDVKGGVCGGANAAARANRLPSRCYGFIIIILFYDDFGSNSFFQVLF